MKLNLITTAAVLAMAGAVMAVPAKAQFVATSQDLILSFFNNAPGATGGETNYEFDLGQYSTYANAVTSIDIANVNTDLASVYGSNYFSNENLQAAILGVSNSGVGANGLRNGTVFASNNTTTPYTALKGSTLGGLASKIGTMYNPALNTPLPVAGTVVGSFKVPTDNDSSFNFVTSQGVNFSAEAASFGIGMAPQLYLNILQPGASPFVNGTSTILANGYFDITSAGELQFLLSSPNGGQVPEPSTYAMMLIGGAMLAAYLRRKKASSL